ncbi:hypothetical protein [Roseimarinus sediminis]|uniref:hypothetical protein n=1 Tax=Roseimarinus sediminis TaxID=1610899 RepID=UPI003D24F6A1
MNQLPPLVLECPECGERYLISRNQAMPSEKATLYSDGFYIDQVNWRTPLIIGCVTCELGFFPEKGKLIAEPEWDEFNEKWSEIRKAEAPTAGALALELRARRNMNTDEALALRREFWYAGVHSETGRLLMSRNKKFEQFWLNSLEQLEAMTGTESNEALRLKAEMNRQLGRFDQCLELLKNLSDKQSRQIAEKAGKKESGVFILN